jgi:hypothetical protein
MQFKHWLKLNESFDTEQERLFSNIQYINNKLKNTNINTQILKSMFDIDEFLEELNDLYNDVISSDSPDQLFQTAIYLNGYLEKIDKITTSTPHENSSYIKDALNLISKAIKRKHDYLVFHDPKAAEERKKRDEKEELRPVPTEQPVITRISKRGEKYQGIGGPWKRLTAYHRNKDFSMEKLFPSKVPELSSVEQLKQAVEKDDAEFGGALKVGEIDPTTGLVLMSKTPRTFGTEKEWNEKLQAEKETKKEYLKKYHKRKAGELSRRMEE